MKKDYLIKIPGLTREEQTKFIHSNLETNLQRLKIAGLAFLIIQIVMLIATLIPGILNLSDQNRMYYIYLYIIIIPTLILFATFMHFMKKRLSYKNMIPFRLLVSLFMMIVLIWSVCIILFGYENGFLPNVYILVLISTAVIPFFNLWEIIPIIAPAQILLTYYVVVERPFSADIAGPLLFDSWGFVIICIIISYLFYRLRIRNFKQELQLVKQNDQLKQHSEIDSLTDIFNRRKLDEIIEEEWKRSSRNKLPVAFLLIDLDHFKDFNDSYGHIEGDLCLRKAAAIMKDTLKRSTDSIYRYGGEEFGVILPFTSLDAAEIVAERLRKNIEKSCIPHTNTESGYLTVSIGLTSRVGTKEGDFHSLYIEADKALYAAKRSGRNKVISYED